ncbi:hypothetical protein U0035_16260 [Niabella yanshanensis]|uniref:DUF4369 domain-containing protein n=1 Tax=Niabella yanshanensis TaxID=577386 RepID=A0ABZ0W1S4_9BACT|nr:hypothetical protein [Niabella yanshanensis]WQD37223.1 hypothetical protein U0035_16260 [Niabella yanshanensis]
MKRFLPLVITLFTLSTLHAQLGKGGGMGGGRPGGGDRPGGPPTGQFKNVPSGNFFIAELQDGTNITGSGVIKFKNDLATVEIKTPEGKELTYTPFQLKQLSRNAPGGMEVLINFDNKYWLSKLNKNVEQFYQAESEDELLFIKEKNKFRIATKEDIIGLVKENKDAYKQAKKGHVKKALLAYIGEPQPERNEFREMRENIDVEKAEKKKQLFNQ